MQRSRTIVRKL